MKKIFYLLHFLIPPVCAAQPQIIAHGNIHLRDGSKREWSSFPLHAKDSQFVIHFKTHNVSNAKTLAVTQTDVNHVWKVLLNEKPLGNLEPDEQKMDVYFSIPANTLN